MQIPAEIPLPVLSLVVIDDHDLIRMALQAIIESNPDYQWQGAAATVNEAELLLLRTKPHIAIVDIDIGGEDGLDMIQRMAPALPGTRFMVLSGHRQAVTVRRSIAVGAYAYLLKNNVLSEIHPALQSVRRGVSFLSPDLSRLPDIVMLTPRQLEVLRGIASGASSKSLGRELGISDKTVEFHKNELRRRLGVTDLASLTRYAVEHGLLK